MIVFQIPEPSHSWETIGYMCLTLAIICEAVELGLELREHGWRWRNLAAWLAILFLVLLVSADWKAGSLRSQADQEKNALLAKQGFDVDGLTKQANRAQKTIAQQAIQIDDANKKVAEAWAVTDQLSTEIRQLQNEPLGPFRWTVSINVPNFRDEPSTSGAGTRVLGRLPKADKEVSVTHVSLTDAGISFVEKASNTGIPSLHLSCSHPPYFYLISEPSVQASFQAGQRMTYKLPLRTGMLHTGPSDSGPISITFPASAIITAAYANGYDERESCYSAIQSNVTITYYTRGSALSK